MFLLTTVRVGLCIYDKKPETQHQFLVYKKSEWDLLIWDRNNPLQDAILKHIV
jgi:hypothetical protein